MTDDAVRRVTMLDFNEERRRAGCIDANVRKGVHRESHLLAHANVRRRKLELLGELLAKEIARQFLQHEATFAVERLQRHGTSVACDRRRGSPKRRDKPDWADPAFAEMSAVALPAVSAPLAPGSAHRTLERMGDAWCWEGKPVRWEDWGH